MATEIVYLGTVSSVGFSPNLTGELVRWSMRKNAGGDFVISLTDSSGTVVNCSNNVFDLEYVFSTDDKRVIVLEDTSSGKRVEYRGSSVISDNLANQLGMNW
jgi:hypothetical protein